MWMRSLLQCLTVALMLWSWSLVRVPIPGVNEPHYLTKSRHYWDPDWIQAPPQQALPHGDVFLDSANPHLFFYSTFGYLTHVLPLHAAACWGRLLGCLVVAAGWVQLCVGMCHVPEDSAPQRTVSWPQVLMPLALLLLLQACGNWSGEWLIGGIESKVPAYGLLFFGLGSLLLGQWCRAGLACGLAVSFHPLVGGWGVIAMTAMLLWEWCRKRAACPNWKTLVCSSVLFIGAVSLGTIPAIQMIVDTDPAQAAAADYLMVAHRLSHHLDPVTFPTTNWRYFGFLLALWGLLRVSHATTANRRRWELVVLAALVIAAVGVAAAWGPRPLKDLAFVELRVKMLKFYPFRLADLLVPLAVAFEIFDYLSRQTMAIRQRWSQLWQQSVVLLATGAIMALATQLPGSDRNPSGLSTQQQADWIVTCEWIRDHTPPQALLYATNERWAVKWYAERSEYVNYKDCPQDARSLLEWNRRQWVISKWHTATFADWKVTPEELATLHAQTGITHLLVSRTGPILQTPVFEQGDFKVYELPVR